MPMIEGLSRKFIRSAGKIKHLVSIGESGQSVLEVLREEKRGYRSQDFYRDMRIYKGANERWQEMKKLPEDKIVDESYFVKSDREMDRQFAMVVKYEIQDRFGHIVGEDYLTIYSDRILTVKKWKKIAKPIAEKYDHIIGEVELVEAYTW